MMESLEKNSLYRFTVKDVKSDSGVKFIEGVYKEAEISSFGLNIQVCLIYAEQGRYNTKKLLLEDLISFKLLSVQ